MIDGHLFDRLHAESGIALRNGAPTDFILDRFETLMNLVLTPAGPGLVVGIQGPSPVIGEHLLVTVVIPFSSQ